MDEKPILKRCVVVLDVALCAGLNIFERQYELGNCALFSSMEVCSFVDAMVVISLIDESSNVVESVYKVYMAGEGNGQTATNYCVCRVVLSVIGPNELTNTQ